MPVTLQIIARDLLIPPGSNEIFGLDFARPNLSVLGIFLNVLDQFFLLVLELDSLPV